jgi:drug/metabolite transporter superfamily protein YnfA
MSFVGEMWSFLRTRKKYWLVPAMVLLAIFGALIALASGSAVAPFIYTLF